MSFLSSLRAWVSESRKPWWDRYAVQITGMGVQVEQKSFARRPIHRSVCWEDVQRTEFLDGELGSDVYYLYTANCDDPVLVPVRAPGGERVEQALRDRGLHPDDLKQPEAAPHAVGAR